jgi:hypothetical protein
MSISYFGGVIMKRVTILVLLILAIGLMGCAEDLEKKSTSRPSTSGSAEVSAEKESGSSGLSEKFMDFVTKKVSAEYMVEYDMKMTGDETQSFVMTQYIKGEKMRFDMDTPEGDVRSYMMDNAFYTCTNTEGDWMCMKMSMDMTGQDSTMQTTGYFEDVESAPDNYDISYDGTMRVAGAMTACFKISFAESGFTGELRECFSKEGVPLYMLVEGDGSKTEMKAKSYERSVSSSAFELPAEAQDLSAMMGGMY